MAESPTPEQLEVRRKGRQRLIGAVVIVLLAVVFVPMVLDPEPDRIRKEPSLAIPAKEGATPLPAPEAAKPAAPPAEVKPAPSTAKAPAEPKPLEAKVLKSKPASIPAPAPASVAAASVAPVAAKPPTVAPKLEGFAIQVGAFRDEEKLKQARDKLTAAKIAHFTERLPSSDLTRVRAGPYATKEAAEKALAAVTLAGLEGKVVPLP